MDYQAYGKYILDETLALLAIDSPSGMTAKAAEHVMARFAALGYQPERTRKDGVVVCLGGKNMDDAILLEAHMDTLGGMVAEIKGNGRLRITRIGGLNANNVETETCRVYTKFDGVYEGTAQLINPSIHVNGKYDDTARTFDTIEIVLDEDVKSADDVKKLGIRIVKLLVFILCLRIKIGYGRLCFVVRLVFCFLPLFFSECMINRRVQFRQTKFEPNTCFCSFIKAQIRR